MVFICNMQKFKWLKNLELLYVEKNEIDFKIFRLTIGGVNNGTKLPIC